MISDKEKEEIKAQDNADKRLYSLKLERITDEILVNIWMKNIKIYTFLYLMQSCTSGSSILAEGLTDRKQVLLVKMQISYPE